MTVKARIYQPAKTAMQSGRAKTRDWLLEYAPTPKQVDPLTGWTGSVDTLGQVRLRFPTREAAEEFAREKGLSYEVELPKPRKPRLKSYADNFRFDAVETYRKKSTA